MPTPWKDVAASPQYQALPPDQQNAAREQYFSQVVAPQISDPQAVAQAKAAFDAQYGQPEQVKSLPDAHVQAPTAYDPTDGMSTFDKLRAGAGKAFVDTYRGIQQLGAAGVSLIPGSIGEHAQGELDALKREQADANRRDAPLMDTGAGVVGNLAGSIAATAPLGALSVAAKGSALLPAIGRAALAGGATAGTQPVTGDGSFIGQKAKQVAEGAALGGAVPLAGRGLMSAAENVVPSNIVQRVSNAFVKRANTQPFAQESEALAARTGIPFTPGQVSGAKMQTGLENLSRQSFFSADKAFQADTKTANAAVDYINRTMNNLSPGEVSAEGVGQKVQDTVRNVVQSIANNREATAARQYGAIDKALGGTPVVRYTKTADTLNSILDDYADVPGQAAAGIRSQLQGMLDDIAKKPAYSLASAQKARSAYGRAASGSADIFKDIKTSEQARIAKRLYGAMSDDIETSAAALDAGPRSGPGLMTQTDNALIQRGGLADAWRKANDDYRNYSKLIEATEASPLRRLVGDKVDVGDFMTVNKLPPEKVVGTLGSMSPSELKMVGGVMQRQAPDVWQGYKRLLVQNALDEAQAAPGSMGANTLPLNAAKFVSALGGGKPAKIAQLRALFTPEEYAQIDDAFNAMRRLGDKFGANFSGTAPANEVLGILRGGVRGAVNVASQTIGMRKIANVMLNADGRRALVELSRLPPQSRQAASLAGYITALATADQGVDVGANGQVQQNAGQQQ